MPKMNKALGSTLSLEKVKLSWDLTLWHARCTCRNMLLVCIVIRGRSKYLGKVTPCFDG